MILQQKSEPEALHIKLEKLKQYIAGLGSLAVGFSGGVDSSLLTAVAHEVLGDRLIAVTGADASVPEREVEEAKRFCKERGIRHIICRVDPLKEEGYRHNSPDRCYFCKHGIFTEVKKIAEENGIEYMAEGSNMDDIGDYRPGLRAAAELSVKSPLREAGLTKSEIRLISKEMGLPTWSKPSLACLATRIPYGEEITPEKLKTIDNAEQLLIDSGLSNVRVRAHGEIARIEIDPSEFEKILDKKITDKTVRYLKEHGFKYVTLDLEGYSLGSMNRMLDL